jgi:hypothetical protein
LVGCGVGVVVLHVELSVPGPQPAVGVVGGDDDVDGVDVVLHVELSVPGPQPAVGVVGVDGDNDGVDVVLHVELSVPGPQPATGCCAFIVIANRVKIRIPATATGAIIDITICFCIILL